MSRELGLPGARMAEPAKNLPPERHGEAPFLVWPVSRREFYRTICIAIAPALIWGAALFGARAMAMIVLAIAGTTGMHFLLKRGLKWQRAQCLLYMHGLVSVLMLVALALPSWPIWVVTGCALLLPLMLVAVGGPGRERIHIAVAVALAVQYVLLPNLQAATYTGKGDAVLARDRLFMGDIRDQDKSVKAGARWARSRELSGNDAQVFPRPAVMAAEALDAISALVPAPPAKGGMTELSPEDASKIRRVAEQAISYDLPAMDRFMAGVAPNRVGAASLIAITAAGLYLSYRYILRPRSVLFFVATFIVATYAVAVTPPAVARMGLANLWKVFALIPGEMMTLANFMLLSSDAGFAAVFVLALPGAEPLTARGRKVFLVVAAVAAAGLHRLDPAAPAATLMLCLMMPLAPVFDRLLGQRSWLHRA